MLFIPLQLQTLCVSRNSSRFVLGVARVYTEDRHPMRTYAEILHLSFWVAT